MVPSTKNKKKVIGYWFNEKKSQKFGANELEEACRKRNLELVKIDLEDDLELTSKKYDGILHKLTALCAPALAGDIKAQSLVQKVERYMNEYPYVHIIDPLNSIKKLLLRNDTYSMLASITSQEDNIFTPQFVLLNKENLENLDSLLEENGVTFPVVCKPLLAGGGKDAHEMALVFTKEKLRRRFWPLVVQSFIHHEAVLYKIFILGAKWFVTIRPSLKNFVQGDFETILFNSHHISKPDSRSPLTLLDERPSALPKADLGSLERIVCLVKEAFASDLLGIDVVIDNASGRYAIIDVNAFPGYESVPDVMEHLSDVIRARVDDKAADCETIYLPSIGLSQEYFIQEISKPLSGLSQKKLKPKLGLKNGAV